MLEKLFSKELLITKILSGIGLVILALVTFLYPRILLFFSKTKSETLSNIIILGGTLGILIIFALLIILSFLSSENKQLRTPFIARFGLHWKKTNNKIDPMPYCLCCEPPKPLRFRHFYDGKKTNPEVLECAFGIKDGNFHSEKLHNAEKDGEAISYKTAYELVCKEFKIKPIL